MRGLGILGDAHTVQHDTTALERRLRRRAIQIWLLCHDMDGNPHAIQVEHGFRSISNIYSRGIPIRQLLYWPQYRNSYNTILPILNRRAYKYLFSFSSTKNVAKQIVSLMWIHQCFSKLQIYWTALCAHITVTNVLNTINFTKMTTGNSLLENSDKYA